MSATIYHNPRCTKSRIALALIRERGIDPTIVEYLKSPPSESELRKILAKLGKSPKEIVRRKEAKESGINPDTLSNTALINAMIRNPIIIERPIVVNGAKAVLGRPPENVLTIL